MNLGKAKKFVLSEERVHFNLEDSWLDFCKLDDVNNFDTPNVADSDVFYKSVLNQVFHSFPGLLIGNCVVGLHSWVSSSGVVDPLRRVSNSWVNIL